MYHTLMDCSISLVVVFNEASNFVVQIEKVCNVSFLKGPRQCYINSDSVELWPPQTVGTLTVSGGHPEFM